MLLQGARCKKVVQGARRDDDECPLLFAMIMSMVMWERKEEAVYKNVNVSAERRRSDEETPEGQSFF